MPRVTHYEVQGGNLDLLVNTPPPVQSSVPLPFEKVFGNRGAFVVSGPSTRWYPPKTFVVSRVILAAEIAPVGDDIIVSVTADGVEVYRVTLPDGDNVVIDEDASFLLTDDALVQVTTVQVGSGTAGSHGTLQLQGTVT